MKDNYDRTVIQVQLLDSVKALALNKFLSILLQY